MDIVHEVPKLVIQLSLILLAARVSGELTERLFKAPGVLGELVAGMVIGPYALGGVILPFILGVGAAILFGYGPGPLDPAGRAGVEEGRGGLLRRLRPG